MAFSSVILTGNFGASATGSLTFTLTGRMSNADLTLVPTPVTVVLASGAFSETFAPNDDTGTVPRGVAYAVTELIDAAQPSDYFIDIPPVVIETNGSTTLNSTTVQLSSAKATAAMVGQSITGTGIPTGTTITGVTVGNPINDPFNPAPTLPLNSVTMSAEATATGTGLTLTIGATIDLSMLRPGNKGWS